MSQAKLLWQMLQKYDITVEDAVVIYQQVSGLREEIAELLLKKEPTRDTLRIIIEFARDKVGSTVLQNAVQQFLDKDPSNDDLVFVVLRCVSWRKGFMCDAGITAWQSLLKNQPTVAQLREVAKYAPQLAEEAWELILELDPSKNDLVSVMVKIPDLRDKAWDLFQKKSPSKHELHSLIREVKELEGSVRRLLDELRNAESHQDKRKPKRETKVRRSSILK